MRPRVDFHYDFSCPYAYLGHTQIEALCERVGADLTWRPFLLGGVFKANRVSPTEAMPPAKMRHNALDMYRWADHFGVPLVMPASHPNRTVLALRAALSCGEHLARASKALFAAYWVRGEDVSEPTIVRDALTAAGLDGGEMLRRAEDAAIKEDLRSRTDVALELGIFGAPTFVVHAASAQATDPGQLFWGQDRLGFVEKAIGGWRVAPVAMGAPGS